MCDQQLNTSQTLVKKYLHISSRLWQGLNGAPDSSDSLNSNVLMKPTVGIKGFSHTLFPY